MTKDSNSASKPESKRGAFVQLASNPTNSSFSDEDIELAFKFFGATEGDKDGGARKITAKSMKEMMAALNKKMTKSELKVVFDGCDSITMDEVKRLLRHQSLVDDPIPEAFAILDPSNVGYIDAERMRKVFANLGFGELSDEELILLMESADFDGDGKISLDDFRKLSSSMPGGHENTKDNKSPPDDAKQDR